MKSSENREKMDNKTIEFWRDIFIKMSHLLDAILKAKGNYDIDDTEIRWVDDRIKNWQTDDRLLTQDEMRVANNLWNLYGRY
tara:strand:+ start:181 stop:426 length:246 start_codon:yes stop_codon:yes gene_type:complete